jgi:hypothetical protein
MQTALLAETTQIRDKADFLLAKPEYRNAEYMRVNQRMEPNVREMYEQRPGIMKNIKAPAIIMKQISPLSKLR